MTSLTRRRRVDPPCPRRDAAAGGRTRVLAGAGARPRRRSARTWSWSATTTCRGRSAYQPTIHQPGRTRPSPTSATTAARARNPLTGAEEDNGTSIVDVTDPAAAALSRRTSPGWPAARAGRRADGARVRPAGQDMPADGRSATPVPNSGPRGVGRDRPDASRRRRARSSPASPRRTRTGGSATPGSRT